MPTINDIKITFNDPDGYFNPDNVNSIFYNYSPIGKIVIIRLKNVTSTTLQTITVFRGRVNRLPELSKGFASISCSDGRKYILNQKLTGADSDSTKKLMTINQAGGLVDSTVYNNSWNAPPYDFEVSGGSLPTGLSLSTTGTISGTPSESGTFNFTVKATNNVGEWHSIDCELFVDPNSNDDFENALGLGDYTEVDKSTTTEMTSRASWYRATFNGNYEWDADSDDAPHLYIDGPSGLSGNWTLYGKVKNGFDGQNANYVGLYVRLGEFDGFICGCKSTGASGTFGADVYRAFDGNNIHNTAITTDTIWVKIKKVSTTYYFYYREGDTDSWTALTNTTRAGTPTQVGFMVMADVSGNGYGEIDKMYYKSGALAISTGASLPTGARGQAYSMFIKATGGDGEYTYSVTSGALPGGLSLNTSTGEISGTPTGVQNSSFSVTATDAAANTSEEDFVLVVSEDVYILPSVLPDAIDGTAYSEGFTIYGSGTFDRSVVTVGDRCALGKWEITFTDTANFKITGQDVSDTIGSKNSEFSITNVITIPTSAWEGNFRDGDTVEFITGKSYEYENAVSIIYDLYTTGNIAEKELNASSFFGDKEIGKLNADAASSATSIQIKIDVPTLIKTGESLQIVSGSTTETVTVTTGNAESTSFPPYITLTVSALTNSFPGGATVTWLERGTKDIDYTFDSFWNYCDINGFNLSITFDREITLLQCVELAGAHAGIYGMHSRGVLNMAGLIKRWTESLDTIDQSIVLSNTTNIASMEVYNSFKIDYAYNYSEQKFAKTYIYPETDAANTSLTTHGYKREKSLRLPGYYSESIVQTLAEYLYNIFSSGLKIISFETDLKTFSALIGERYDLDSTYPAIDTEVELYGYTLNLLKKYSVVLHVVDRSHLTEAESPFLLMPDGTPIQMPDGTKIRRPDTW